MSWVVDVEKTEIDSLGYAVIPPRVEGYFKRGFFPRTVKYKKQANDYAKEIRSHGGTAIIKPAK